MWQIGGVRALESAARTLTRDGNVTLVIATLHTNDTAQTIDRIIDVFPPAQQEQVRTQLSMALQAVIAQRLIPKIGGGRVAAYEILIGTSAVSNLIREGKIRQIRNVLATGARDGMQVMELGERSDSNSKLLLIGGAVLVLLMVGVAVGIS